MTEKTEVLGPAGLLPPLPEEVLHPGRGDIGGQEPRAPHISGGSTFLSPSELHPRGQEYLLQINLLPGLSDL